VAGAVRPKPANEVITDSGAAKPAIPGASRSPGPQRQLQPQPRKPFYEGKSKSHFKNGQRERGDHRLCRGPQPSACEPYREAIDVGLSRGRNAMAIWQDLVSEYGFTSSYQSVQRFVRKRRGTQTPEARVVIVTAAGQEAQVDYGTGPWCAIPRAASTGAPGCS